MHALAIIGGILGLLAIAGGQALVVFAVRAGLLLTVAFFAYALYDIERPRTFAERCLDNPGSCPDTWPGDPWAAFNPHWGPQPAARPAAAPPPPAPRRSDPDRPIHLPLQDVAPVPPLPAQTVGGWGVDDLSGPWPADDIRPASARADRLLRRFHQAQGVDE